MGLSASQARLLALTSRLSDLELQAQTISNAKLRLADASSATSEAYEDALNKQKITVWSGVNSSGNSTYVDATAYNLTMYGAIQSVDKQRFLRDSSGRMIVSEDVGASFDASQNQGSQAYKLQQQYATVDDYLQATLGYSTETGAVAAGKDYDADAVTYYTNVYIGFEEFLNGIGYTSDSDFNTDSTLKQDDGATSQYANIFNEIAENGYNAVSNQNMTSEEWLYAQLNSGNIYLAEYDKDNKLQDVSWSSGDTSITTQSDETDTAKAEAEYQASMDQIEAKDKRYDLQLKNIDTEHSAIQTEMDSVQKVIDKNIERSFKVFDA